jgi:hypothetical protein
MAVLTTDAPIEVDQTARHPAFALGESSAIREENSAPESSIGSRLEHVPGLLPRSIRAAGFLHRLRLLFDPVAPCRGGFRAFDIVIGMMRLPFPRHVPFPASPVPSVRVLPFAPQSVPPARRPAQPAALGTLSGRLGSEPCVSSAAYRSLASGLASAEVE